MEIVASCYWRLGRPLPARRRVQRAEAGAIAQAREGSEVAEERRVDLLSDLEHKIKIVEKALAAGDHETIRRTLDPDGTFFYFLSGTACARDGKPRTDPHVRAPAG